LKYLDVNSGTITSNSTGLVTLMNGVSIGDTAITRDGRQVWWKSVLINGWFYPHDTALPVGSRNDMYVILDSQPGAALAGMTDIFVQDGVPGSPMNLNNSLRFKVLAHKTWSIGPYDRATAGFPLSPGPTPIIKIYKRFNILTQYKGDNALIGDIATNAIYLVTVGSQAIGESWDAIICSRMRFGEN